MDFLTVGLLLITIVFWGFWGFFQKIGVSKIGTNSSLFLGYFTEFTFVLSYLILISSFQIPTNSSVIYPIMGGAAGTIGTIAFFMTLEKTPVSVARPMAGLCSIVTVLLSLFFLGETLTILQYIGVGLAIAAIMLLSS